MQEHSIAILAIGDELLDGRLRDGNAHFICGEASELGIPCKHILCCGDTESEIVHSLEFLSDLVDLVIVSGGLGPTTDDRTRNAIAVFCKDELILDQASLASLKERYANRGRSFDKSNEQQAWFPSKARILENPFGTAPAFLAKVDGLTIIALPGVPSELQELWKLHCEPYIKDNFNLGVLSTKYYCVFGYPESKLNSVITALSLPSEVVVSYRASFPFIQLVFKSKDSDVLDAVTPKVEQTIGRDFIVCEDPEESLVKVVISLLRRNGYTLTVAESCTGGLLGSEVTTLPGVSDTFLGGVISYSNDLKVESLGVRKETLQAHGAVSFETAREMAGGVRERLGSDCALSITGIAGPDGGSAEKPVGLFYVGCATPTALESFEFVYKADREKVQRFAAMSALDCLRRKLLGLSPYAKQP